MWDNYATSSDYLMKKSTFRSLFEMKAAVRIFPLFSRYVKMVCYFWNNNGKSSNIINFVAWDSVLIFNLLIPTLETVYPKFNQIPKVPTHK